MGDDPTAREDLIYNEKGTKVHRPDPAEASTEPFLWRSRCGAWPYGIRRFFRVSEKPAAAAWCARCFPAKAGGDGEGSPTRAGGLPGWRPARRLSRTAPRLRKERLRWSTGVPGGA